MSNITSFSDRQQAREMAQDVANQNYYPSRPQYASSTYSTSTTATERPLLKSSEKSSSSRKFSSPKKTSSSDKKEKKTSKAWEKTKKVLSAIGDPPTLEYDRQQALREIKEGKRDLDQLQPGMGFGPFNDRPGGRPFGGLT